MIEAKINAPKTTGKRIRNTPAQYKTEFPWLKEVDSFALVNAQNHLETAFQNFFHSPDIGFPNFKSKKFSRKSYTTKRIVNNIGLSETTLRLPKVGEIKSKLHRPVPEGYKLKSVTVSQTPSEAYYASILLNTITSQNKFL